MANLETLQKLLELRCDPNPPLQGLGITPLLSAVALSRGNPKSVEIVRSLLEARANPNVASRHWVNASSFENAEMLVVTFLMYL